MSANHPSPITAPKLAEVLKPNPVRTANAMEFTLTYRGLLIGGLVAAAPAFAWFEHRQAATPPADTIVPKVVYNPVVVATTDIAARQVITPSMVTVRMVDSSKDANGVEIWLNNVVNQVAIGPVKAGEQITINDVRPNVFPVNGFGGGMIKDGYRAMTITLNPTSSVAGYIKPGGYVDLVGTLNLAGGRTVARTIAPHVLLIATGEEALQATPDRNEVKADNASEPMSPKEIEVPNATVLVSATDADKLVVAGRKSAGLILVLSKN
jgi:Flp pilus assembly protein CpaB